MALVIADLAGGREIPRAGGYKSRLFEITGDSAYSAGGTAVTPANFGLTSIIAISGQVSAGRILSYDAVNAKLMTFRGAAAASALAEDTTADQSASKFRVEVIGT